MTDMLGKTFVVTQPEPDPTCFNSECALHRDDLLFPLINLYGKSVLVTETGLLYKDTHPAVRVAFGPIDWHPRVAITLTDDQVRALGLTPTVAITYLISGTVMATDSADGPIGGVEFATDFDFARPWPTPVELPHQQQEIVPVCCLRDNVMSAADRRRENRLRRDAASQGLKIRKMRGTLSVHARGPYWIANDIGTAVAGEPWSRIGLDLTEVENTLRLRLQARAGSTRGS